MRCTNREAGLGTKEIREAIGGRLAHICFGLREDAVRAPNLRAAGKRPTPKDDELEMGNL